MIKRRYEFCSETKEVIDNELDNYVEDVVERLNTQDSNKKDLLKQYHLLEDEIKQKEQQISKFKQQLKEKTEILNELLKGDREDVKKLSNEIKNLKLQLFAFVRNSAVAPVGLKLNKTQQEITDKTFETIRAANKVISVEKMRAFMNLATNKEDRYDN